MIHLRAENLGFSYGQDDGDLNVIDNLNLCVPKGEILAILGPSGCGKSTLLRLLSGFLKGDKGNVSIDNKKLEEPIRSGQMIFQDTAQLLPWLNVERNILFPRHRDLHFRTKKRPKNCDNLLLDEILISCSLNPFRSFYPRQLSGGMKQRVSLARAIYSQPSTLYMDEPFVSLDSPSRRELQNLLLGLWERWNCNIFFVTHDVNEALLLSDRILILPGRGEKPQIIENDLKRPRKRDDQRFLSHCVELYSLVESLNLRL